jgi:hypothetical protein
MHRSHSLAALAAFARLLHTFSDPGLDALLAAARAQRLIRGAWSSATGGCPLSCADGILGASTARRFWWQAADRNRFVLAWDAGLIAIPDLVALVERERLRRAQARRGRWAAFLGRWEQPAQLLRALASLPRPALVLASRRSLPSC